MGRRLIGLFFPLAYVNCSKECSPKMKRSLWGILNLFENRGLINLRWRILVNRRREDA